MISTFTRAVCLAIAITQVSSMTGGRIAEARGDAVRARVAPTSASADTSWSPVFNQIGTDDHVMCGMVRQDTLIIGGLFQHVGAQEIHGVAATDGTRWWGYGSGLADSVLCLVEWNGQLVAGGSFTTAEGAPANYLAVWNGAAWQPFPVPVNHRVNALAVYHGTLIAGGFFTGAGSVSMSRIGAWDGTTWSPLGQGVELDTPEVFALRVWRDTLAVGGRFLQAGGQASNRFALWDGVQWRAFPQGPDGTVWNLAEWNGLLVVSGAYGFVGSLVGDGVITYDGTAFQSLDWGMNNSVDGVCAYHDELYAIGEFSEAGMRYGGTPAACAARWNGSGWQGVGTGLMPNASGRDGRHFPVAIVYHDMLVCGGWFAGGGGLVSPRLVAWNDTTWGSLTRGQGVDADPLAACVYHGQLVVGGWFNTAGEAPFSHIAAWTGTGWTPVGIGVNDSPVSALTTFGDSLVVGGTFSVAGGVNASCIAVWDGIAWHPLGSGFNGPVTALTVWNGRLIAGGSFTKSGSRTTSHVAVWLGTGWFPLQGGVDGPVSTLGVFNGSLIVGGQFHTAGAGLAAECVASFNGNSWQALGSGLTLSGRTAWAQSQTVWNGTLIVGGTFTSAGGVPANYLAAWDGTAWQEVGAGIQGPNLQVAALLVDSTGALVVGGTFSTAGSVTCNGLARWDGAGWSAYGTGFVMDYSTGGVWDLEFFDGSLFAVGSMNTAGGKKSNNIARWDPPPALPVAIQPDVLEDSGRLRWRVAHSRGGGIVCETDLPRGGIVGLSVVDVCGRTVRKLSRTARAAGVFRIEWDGRTGRGERLPRGVYLLRLDAGGNRSTARVVWIE